MPVSQADLAVAVKTATETWTSSISHEARPLALKGKAAKIETACSAPLLLHTPAQSRQSDRA
eukprot:5008841-Pleurochrysis_carterae.AAC.6